MSRQLERKSFAARVIKADAAAGIVEAVVNVFGIVDDAPNGGDIIHSGAFVKTITERFGRIRVLDNHNADSIMNVIGKPLEIREMKRDDLPEEVKAEWPMATGGLYTKTQYAIDTPEGLGAFKRIADSYVNEYSIAFNIVKGKSDYGEVKLPDGSKRVVRHIREVSLWEYSPVIWGMNPATYTADVKGDEAGEKEMLPEGAQMRLGDVWKAAVYGAHMMECNDALYIGLISADEHRAMCEFGMKLLDMLDEAMSEDMRARPVGSPRDVFRFGRRNDATEKYGNVENTDASAVPTAPAEPPNQALTDPSPEDMLAEIERLQQEIRDVHHPDGGYRSGVPEGQPASHGSGGDTRQ